MAELPFLRILIVDDDVLLVNILQFYFHNTGHIVTAAYDGAEALDMLKKSPFDLVIADIHMPEMDGVQLMQEALRDYPLLYFILITGESAERSFEELIDLGALSCLVKPFKRSELIALIDVAVQSKKNRELFTDKYGDSPELLNGRRQAVEAGKSLWNRDQRFQAVMNTAHDAIIFMDDLGNITFWNPAAEKMFGYSRQEVIGKSLHSIIVPEKYRRVAENGLGKFVKTGRGPAIGKTIEVLGLKKDQTEIPIELSISGFKYQDTWHAAGIIRNVASRKQNEQMLLSAHEELERLYQQLNHQYEIAGHVFSKIVLKNENPGKNINCFLSTMDAAGGDLFLTSSGIPGLRQILLGDFTGHGLSAAIGAIPVASVFYAMAEKGYSVRNIASEINNRLKAILPTGLFLCACMIECNYVHHMVRVYNFGLPDAIVVGADGYIKTRLRSLFLPLGIMHELEPECHAVEIHMEPGDRIYIFTDGITEARNNTGELLGQERLELLLTRNQNLENPFDYICSWINEFRGDTPQSDDMAILEITWDTHLEDFPKESQVSWRTADLPEVLNLSFTLHADALRTDNFVDSLIDLLIRTDASTRAQKQNLFLILSELYSNALEHGILRMDSSIKSKPGGFDEFVSTRLEKLAALSNGWIKIELKLFVHETNGRIILWVEDSGHGFDLQCDPVDPTTPICTEPLLSGRGLFLVRSLCRDFIIEGNGNKVTAVYEW